MSITLHTNLGDIKIELFCELTPKTAKNFLGLIASGYYDNTIFHRLIRDFIVQGGSNKHRIDNNKDKDNKEKAGKDKNIYGKQYFEDEIVDSLKFNQRGCVAMANKGANTNSSQFFITFKAQPQLNNTATIFGKVIHGYNTLDAMEKSEVDNKNRPSEPIKILSTTIHANPIADKEMND
mmetsp:Transcript_74040/g.66633  ORF Transcript_74040/g.66633 Transcript_74040/m.66633 type:complete len:179 (+) Transcript_74040:19-555(+)